MASPLKQTESFVIYQPNEISSGNRCQLCQQMPATFERKSYHVIGKNIPLPVEHTVLQICRDCNLTVEKLESFRKEAIDSEKFVSKIDTVQHKLRLCRFCSITGVSLEDLFDGKGTAIDGKLLAEIWNRLAIQIKPQDAITTVCQACIRSVNALAFFRIDYPSKIVYLSGSAKSASTLEDKESLKTGLSDRDQELLKLLETPHDERNFVVHLANAEPRLQVKFEHHYFQLSTVTLSGTSLWKCVRHRLRKCAAKIEINAQGTIAAGASSGHSHSVDSEKLLECPPGKGFTMFEGSEHTFWLTYGSLASKKLYTRCLFLDGHRYYLVCFKNAESGSNWYCGKAWVMTNVCKVRLSVDGIFERVTHNGKQHNHEPLSPSDMLRYLENCGVDLESLTAAAFQRASSNPPNVMPRLDVGKNFTIKRTAKGEWQINYRENDFRWWATEADGTSEWCCIWHDIRQCQVRILVSSDRKLATLIDPSKEHNHPEEVIAILGQKSGKYIIFDEHENNEFHYKLSSYQFGHLPDCEIDYQGYRYNLVTIADNGDSVWKCKHLQCKVSVRVVGLFWIIDYQCSHTHSPLTMEDIENDKDLLPYGTPANQTHNIPLSSSKLFEILVIDEPERNFQMHHHNRGSMKILQDGYEYYYCCSKPTYSLWKCIYSSIRCCGATLHVDNHGRIGVPSPFRDHNHSIELWDLYYCRLGERTIVDALTDSTKQLHFLMKPDFLRPLPYLIYEGHIYTLVFITETGDCSKWRCLEVDCSVALTVTGLLEKLAIEGLPHREVALSKDEQASWIDMYGVPDEF